MTSPWGLELQDTSTYPNVPHKDADIGFNDVITGMEGQPLSQRSRASRFGLRGKGRAKNWIGGVGRGNRRDESPTNFFQTNNENSPDRDKRSPRGRGHMRNQTKSITTEITPGSKTNNTQNDEVDGDTAGMDVETDVDGSTPVLEAASAEGHDDDMVHPMDRSNTGTRTSLLDSDDIEQMNNHMPDSDISDLIETMETCNPHVQVDLEKPESQVTSENKQVEECNGLTDTMETCNQLVLMELENPDSQETFKNKLVEECNGLIETMETCNQLVLAL